MNTSFLTFLSAWMEKLRTITWKQLEKDPKKIAIISVDMIVGFCHTGSLASPEVKNIIPTVVNLFTSAYTYGIATFILVQDAHDYQASEFVAYPPHCIKGSAEAETIPELKVLPFAHLFKTFTKNSLSPAYETAFDEWVKNNPQINTFVIVGDCTDLCIYETAMHLKLWANSKNYQRRVVVIEEAVATYNVSVEKAKDIGALPHDAKLLHPLFLYHMALNAIEVIRNIC